jgi:ribonuclease T2
MKLYQRLVLICLGGWAMFVISGCEARPPGSPKAAQKADYDYYVLSLSLAPAFCEDALGRSNQDRRHVPHQCRDTGLADFQRQPLSLHGLWPSRLSGRHDFFCDDARDRGGMCGQPRVSLPEPLASRLAVAMPGTADCLERHEWAKHGACTGLSAEVYFDEAIKLVARANRAIGAELADHAGREVGLDTLRADIRQRDPALLESAVFDCRTPRSDIPAQRRPMLREVRLYFQVLPDGRPGEPMDFHEAGVKHFNSGCPAGRAYVDAP